MTLLKTVFYWIFMRIYFLCNVPLYVIYQVSYISVWGDLGTYLPLRGDRKQHLVSVKLCMKFWVSSARNICELPHRLFSMSFSTQNLSSIFLLEYLFRKITYRTIMQCPFYLHVYSPDWAPLTSRVKAMIQLCV